MFCPNCGKSEQSENTYCRSCGEFLPDSTKNSQLFFVVNTPQQKANIISGVSLIAFVFSLFFGWWLYATKFNIPLINWLATAFLIFNAVWHISNFFAVQNLAKLPKVNKEKTDLQKQIVENKPFHQNALPSADLSNVVPVSVTENTTQSISGKIKINLSHAEQ